MNGKHLVAALSLAMLAAPAGAQSVKAGIDAWQRADYARAVAIWRPLAEQGDADAQFNLGQAFRLGRGVTINLGAAKSWFERAAEKGHVDAQTTLGLLLFQNGDQAQGLKWLKQAAERDEPRAQLVYGTALYNGDGVPQDRVRGYAYVSRAASLGLAPARDTLSQLDGLMPAADRQKAIRLAIAQAKSPAPPAKVSNSAQRPGKPKPARSATALPPAAVPATGSWRIQLGAFGQRASAEALYRQVGNKPALAGRGPFYIRAGAVIRLQVGPFTSKSTAAAACGALAIPCFPVPAK